MKHHERHKDRDKDPETEKDLGGTAPGTDPAERPPAGSTAPEAAPAGEKSGGAAKAAAPADAAAPAAAGDAARLEELARKAEERDLYRNELLRQRADFANYQKRVVRDRPQVEAQAVRRFVYDLLPVLDNFDRALAQSESAEGLRTGIEMVRRMLIDALARHGFEEIDPLGKVFDPSLHEAVAHEEHAGFPPDTVCEVLEKGYTHNGVVVRAAKVKVARAPLDVAAPPTGGSGG